MTSKKGNNYTNPKTVAQLIKQLKEFRQDLYVTTHDQEMDVITHIVGAKEVEGHVLLFTIGNDPDDEESGEEYMAGLLEDAYWDADDAGGW